MPVSTKIDLFSKQPIRPDQPLRTPQARVLAALQPEEIAADMELAAQPVRC